MRRRAGVAMHGLGPDAALPASRSRSEYRARGQGSDTENHGTLRVRLLAIAAIRRAEGAVLPIRVLTPIVEHGRAGGSTKQFSDACGRNRLAARIDAPPAVGAQVHALVVGDSAGRNELRRGSARPRHRARAVEQITIRGACRSSSTSFMSGSVRRTAPAAPGLSRIRANSFNSAGPPPSRSDPACLRRSHCRPGTPDRVSGSYCRSRPRMARSPNSFPFSRRFSWRLDAELFLCASSPGRETSSNARMSGMQGRRRSRRAACIFARGHRSSARAACGT